MPVRHTHKIDLLRRRERIADLYIQGWTQCAIAEHLGLAQTTISYDLRKIQLAWRESAVRDFDAARDLELRKIDRVEKEAWAAWERSQQPLQSAHISDETHQRKSRRVVKNQIGNPKYLEIVGRCVAQRCSLLGLGITGMEVNPDGTSVTERRQRIVTIMGALRDAGIAVAGAGPSPDEPRLLGADRERGTVDAGPPPEIPG